MANRTFTISGGGITVENTAVTLVFLNPTAAPDPNYEILRCWIGQSANATSAQQRVQLVTQVTAFPTLTSVTPRPHGFGDPTASLIVGGTAGAAGTCGIDASAEGGGAVTVLLEDAFNVLNGWLWVPTPNETIVMAAGSVSGFGLHLPVAPATLTNWAFGITYRERV